MSDATWCLCHLWVNPPLAAAQQFNAKRKARSRLAPNDPPVSLTDAMIAALREPTGAGSGRSMTRRRTDAERRARQCERLSRLLRVLRLILGPGRWDAEALARELECSPRTVHRDLAALSMAGIPWFFDEECKAYRVRPGFKFPALEPAASPETGRCPDPIALIANAKKMLAEGERFLDSLRQLIACLEGQSNHSPQHE